MPMEMPIHTLLRSRRSPSFLTLRHFALLPRSEDKSLSAQWPKWKSETADSLLLVQVGDFYEIFHQDARTASHLLNIRLTKRGKGDGRWPMCGFPVHKRNLFVKTLVLAGYRVGVVDQVEGGGELKGEMKTRRVSRIITRATLVEDEFLNAGEHNFLAVAASSGWGDGRSSVGLAVADVSTGDLWIQSVAPNELRDQLSRINPVEFLVAESVGKTRPKTLNWLFEDPELYWSALNEGDREESRCMGGKFGLTLVNDSLFETVPSSSTTASSLNPMETAALSCLKAYVGSALKTNIWGNPKRTNNEIMMMDLATRRSLEITEVQNANGRNSASLTLLGSIKRTCTPGGLRLLRTRLQAPSMNLKQIQDRLDAVSYFTSHCADAKMVCDVLKTVGDPTRALQRIKLGRFVEDDFSVVYNALNVGRRIADEYIVARVADVSRINMGNELRFVSDTLAGVVDVSKDFDDMGKISSRETLAMGNKECAKSSKYSFVFATPSMTCLADLHEFLQRAIVLDEVDSDVADDAANNNDEEADAEDDIMDSKNLSTAETIDDDEILQERVFRQSFSPFYDELFSKAKSAETQGLSEFRQKYQNEFQSKDVKIILTVKNPRIYLVSVPKKFAANWKTKNSGNAKLFIEEPKHTTKADVRFRTKELSDFHETYAETKQKLRDVTKLLHRYLQGLIIMFGPELEHAFDGLDRLDVALSNSQCAEERNLIRPIVTEGTELDIVAGRHLVIEHQLVKFGFVPNDLKLRVAPNEDCSCWLITGPNMGGKSTFLRSNAAIVILAQAGCFVPARSAKIGIVDRLFTRIGASDDIANNRSTFMIEMEETALMLNLASEKSFVIVDELGRGTSPEEGYAIAQASLEELLNRKSRCLFATHFHRLGFDSKSPCVTNPRAIKAYTAEVGFDEKDPDHIVYKYKLCPGVAKSSFGLQVVKQAGVPASVFQRAKKLYQEFKVNE